MEARKRILIINGVNLQELGTREVNIYGTLSFDEYFKTLQQRHPEVELHYFQSNQVGELAEAITQHKDFDGIILNPGAYTHTTLVLADAIKAVAVPVIEVHISNLFGREQYRRHSFIAGACKGQICGFGLNGYEMALNALEEFSIHN
ncbi:MAG: 3-dehydroquinate dehydratase [Bacteroidales bacterium]|jgi:3-dehydroquinate dehydratase-2|nr:3-dehydroquinate dehydratase [Bacteroidales bacterium]